jgi:REP element-mobilizing transposase RayT
MFFGFVIMPNHVHLIWRTKELNGKETAQGSFLKYTAHEFRKLLYIEENRNYLPIKLMLIIRNMSFGKGTL